MGEVGESIFSSGGGVVGGTSDSGIRHLLGEVLDHGLREREAARSANIIRYSTVGKGDREGGGGQERMRRNIP